jgi:hypothetical protein
MTDNWLRAARNLSDTERKTALKNLLENVNETEAGIIRQLLGDELKPLTEKQRYVYETHIEKALVERCGVPGCSNFVPAGTASGYCQTCEVKYGD